MSNEQSAYPKAGQSRHSILSFIQEGFRQIPSFWPSLAPTVSFLWGHYFPEKTKTKTKNLLNAVTSVSRHVYNDEWNVPQHRYHPSAFPLDLELVVWHFKNVYSI